MRLSWFVGAARPTNVWGKNTAKRAKKKRRIARQNKNKSIPHRSEVKHCQKKQYKIIIIKSGFSIPVTLFSLYSICAGIKPKFSLHKLSLTLITSVYRMKGKNVHSKRKQRRKEKIMAHRWKLSSLSHRIFSSFFIISSFIYLSLSFCHLFP
uniref:Uncharacterized protein TCIL3000_10_12770 n=1 Tax=Trypanosoma congolense (strain IL3000) TaxID=1068625 RepID=G0UYM8_TRYCI|nr:unnamed protein product [Trypanosoma congolense IL3000]